MLEKYHFEPRPEITRNNKTYYYGKDISDNGYNYEILGTDMYGKIVIPDYHNFCFEDVCLLLKVQNAETDEEKALIINNFCSSGHSLFILFCFGYVLYYHVVYNGKRLVQEYIGTGHTDWWKPLNLTMDSLMEQPLPKSSMDILGHLSDKEFMGKYKIGFEPNRECVSVPQGYKYFPHDDGYLLVEGMIHATLQI